MLRKIKSGLGSAARGFRGLYNNATDSYSKFTGLDKSVLGKSVEGRDIELYRFGEGNIKILFTGGIHGNEVGTVKLMHRLIEFLEYHSLNVEVYVIPCINPDGHAVALKRPDYFVGGRFGRFNSRDVDLNRNFDTKSFQKENKWKFGSKEVSVFCGENGFSEPETKLLSGFIKDRGISVFYSFHSRGREVMGNLNDLSQKLVQDYIKKTGYKYISDEYWQNMNQTGTAKEWCDENDIAYVEVETPHRWGSDWKNQKGAIISALNYQYG